MALSREESSLVATRLRRDIRADSAESAKSQTINSGIGRGALPYTCYTLPGASLLSRGREWNRVGDFLTGRYDSSRRMWSSSGTRNQYPMVPVVDRFMESQYTPNRAEFEASNVSTDDCLHRQNVHLSSRLPRQVWYLLAKSLGIKLSHSDKPIFGTFLHVFTILSAMAFAIPGCWYTVYDIRSKFSKTTVLIGLVQIIIGFGWACMGVYAHNLAGRLFTNKNFLQCVRVHSKTFLKVSTSWLTLFMGFVIVGVNCYNAEHMFQDNTCETAETHILVCQVHYVGRVVYAVLTLLWNFIVAFVLFSVCRTHTVGIRRFMQELNVDASLYEAVVLQQYNLQRNTQATPTGHSAEGSWYVWDDAVSADSDDEDLTVNETLPQTVQGFSNRHRDSLHSRKRSAASTVISQEGEYVGDAHNITGDNGCASANAAGNERDKVEEVLVSFAGNTDAAEGEKIPGTDEEPTGEEITEANRIIYKPSILTNDDLLFSYWKFLKRLNVTSRFLQRWLASWIAFVIMWDGYFIIYWTSHNATLVGILQFVVPLLILLLICSAYAEVNAEGQRLLKTICPLEERLAILFYFNQQPLTVRVFSFTVTYNAMMTVILGFSVAFASRMILDEISRT